MSISSVIPSWEFLRDVPPPCTQCQGTCCKPTAGWKFVRLTYTERQKDIFKPYVAVHEPTGQQGFFFGQEGCPFLDKMGRCGIHEDRPDTCRYFDCRAGSVDDFLHANPNVVKLIKRQFDQLQGAQRSEDS